MTSFASYEGHDAKFLVQGYSWAELGHATVVDVGGSAGEHGAALARAFPLLEIIVQDLPTVIKAVQKKRQPVDIADRIKFMEHDMFTPQPVAADIYLFRWIFHDWPDKYVIKILNQLVPAMKTGTRVLINEIILPEPNTLPLLRERRLRYVDDSEYLDIVMYLYDPALWMLICLLGSTHESVRRMTGFASGSQWIRGSGSLMLGHRKVLHLELSKLFGKTEDNQGMAVHARSSTEISVLSIIQNDIDRL